MKCLLNKMHDENLKLENLEECQACRSTRTFEVKWQETADKLKEED
jgi:hypothetical protein